MIKRLVCSLLLAVSLPFSITAQQIKEMEFKNKEITDILLALAAISGRSIVPDETVTGTASYYFTETDFDTALKIFLSTYKMYYWKEGDITYVSRVRAVWNSEAQTAGVDAEDVDIRLIVRAISRAAGRTVLFDTLPRESLTIHVEGAKLESVLEVLVKRFPEYRVEAGADFHYIKRLDQMDAEVVATTYAPVAIHDSLYTVKADKVRLRELLINLFAEAGHEYSFFLQSDAILENLDFADKPFEEILPLVLEQANADYTVDNGIYYVFDIQRADVLKKLKTIRTIPLTYVSIQDLPNLFPQDMASQNLYRLDRNSNTIILSGSEEQIGPIEEFIRSVDRPLEGKSYHRFDLSFLKVSELLSLMPRQLSGVEPVALPQANSFVMLLSEENKRAVDEYIALVDRKQVGVPVQLRYIQSEYLLKSLPPSVAREDVLATGDSTLVFFVGSEEKRKQFLRELELIDRPAPQIRYELLVVEYQADDKLNWDISFGLKEAGSTVLDVPAFIGAIGQLFGLNFDVIATFGSLFSLQLNLNLATNRANILADTTLNGLSGQEIRFQNTRTTRFREPEIDPDTGKEKATGVSREINYGLIISMNGWVSGDGMITMKVSSTVSDKEEGTGTAAGSLPGTSEKVVSTNIRTASGKPVVIGGLIQQNKKTGVSKIPVLGDIPLLGILFQTRRDTVQNTEMVIYIVPHVEYPEQREADAGRRVEALYRKLVKDS